MSPEARLADLPSPYIHGSAADGHFGMSLDYDRTIDCFHISPKLHATIDGRPMTVTPGGWRNTVDGNICDPIQLVAEGTVANQPTSSLVLDDGETTWNLTVDKLAPAQWTVELLDPAVTEGQDFSIRVAPYSPGLVIGSVFVDRSGIGDVAQDGDVKTVHVRDGYWSQTDARLHGTSRPGTLITQIDVTVHGCEALAGCSLYTQVPEPALPITEVIP